MSLLITILAGAFIGWLASMIMGTNAQMGALANIVAGIVGAAIGGFIFNTSGTVGFNFMQVVVGVIGACILIGLVKLLFGGGGRRTMV